MARRTKKIKSLISDLFSKFKITTAPIDVYLLAKNLGIQIREDDLGEISGLVFKEGSQVIIGVNETHHRNRKRFTVAHELGHYLLHGQNPLFVDKVFAVKLRDHVSSEAISIEEIEANAFAAELLMPSEMILDEIRNNTSILDSENDDLDDFISDLATRFKVSKQAMTIRLSNLGVLQ